MKNNVKINVPTFIDKCSNTLLGVAGSISLGGLFGHAYRKVVPSEEAFDATATALFGGSLYMIDTVGKKILDSIFKNDGRSTKTLALGIRFAVEAGLAYKLTEFVAKQCGAPFDVTPYDKSFFATSAMAGILGGWVYANGSEKTQQEGLFVTTIERIINRTVKSFHSVEAEKTQTASLEGMDPKNVEVLVTFPLEQDHITGNEGNKSEIKEGSAKKTPPFSLEGMDPKSVEALAACPVEHYHIFVNEEGELEVKEGEAKKVFGWSPPRLGWSIRSFEEDKFVKKFDLINDLYHSFSNFFEKEELGLGKTNWKELKKIKKIILFQLELAKVPIYWKNIRLEWIVKLNSHAETLKRSIDLLFTHAKAASKLKQELNDLDLLDKDHIRSISISYWLFLTNQIPYDCLEREMHRITYKNKKIHEFLEELEENCHKEFKFYQWEQTSMAPPREMSYDCNDFQILMNRLEKYFPAKGKKAFQFSGTKENLHDLCDDLMKCGLRIMKSVANELEKIQSVETRRERLRRASNKASPFSYLSRAFFFLPQAYDKILNLDNDAKNSNVKLLDDNWKDLFFEDKSPQNSWRTLYNEGCLAVFDALDKKWPDGPQFPERASPHLKGEGFLDASL